MRNLILLIVLSLGVSGFAFAQKVEETEILAAASQLSFFGGTTNVTFSSAFTGALTTLQLTPGGIHPTRIRNGRANFPITDGTVESTSLKGEIVHNGGLTLTKGSTKVKLQSFIIDTTGTAPKLTGLVSVNGNVVGRIPLFDLQLTPPSIGENFTFVNLSNVRVTLRQEAATALNTVFGTTAFTAGFNIGTANVRGFAFVN
jgi:hypothetical protein